MAWRGDEGLWDGVVAYELVANMVAGAAGGTVCNWQTPPLMAEAEPGISSAFSGGMWAARNA